MSTELIPVKDVQVMAAAIAKSGLFGMKTPEQALALMLIAQAEGMHPAIAARDYHVIQGRPALKADALLARFQTAGGKVEWHEYTDAKVEATFSHPQGGSVRIDWDMARAKAAGLTGKDNWQKYPRQMLRARVISEGIRTVYPGCSVGIYTVEEVQDMAPDKAEPVQEAVVVEPKPAGNGTDKALEKFKTECDRLLSWFKTFKERDRFFAVLGMFGYEKLSEIPADKRAEFIAKLKEAQADIQKAHEVADKLGMAGESAAEIDEPAPAQVEAEFEEAGI